MNFDPNNLYYWMVKIYSENKTEDNKIQIFNEGGSRSSKTWDAFHLIVTFCDHNRNSDKPLEIYILRKTLTECRDKTFEEFKKVLQIIGIYDRNCHTSFPKPNYNLYGNVIKFRGLDDEKDSEGYPSDITFVNEMLELESESKIAGIKMRCRKLFMGDWNPKYTQHWAFEYEGRPDTFFSKTTYKNNKHLEKSVVKEIQSYDPSIDENVNNGTADEWRHKVYGLGERANKDGLVFPHLTWTESITKDTEKRFFGLDFGNTTGIYALAEGAYNQDGIHFDCPIYGSFANKEQIATDSNSGLKNFWTTLKSWLDSEGLKDEEIIIVSDSAQPQKIADLNMFAENDGYATLFTPCKKFAGCVVWRLDIINRHHLHLVNRLHVKKEQENYAYRTIHGIAINEPIDDFNHFFDACGYAIQYEDYLRT